MRRGEISRKEFDRRMAEGTRKDVDKSGHARKPKRKKRGHLSAKRKRTVKRSRKMAKR